MGRTTGSQREGHERDTSGLSRIINNHGRKGKRGVDWRTKGEEGTVSPSSYTLKHSSVETEHPDGETAAELFRAEKSHHLPVNSKSQVVLKVSVV